MEVDSGFLEITITYFTLIKLLFFDLLFTFRLKGVVHVYFPIMFLAYFIVSKVFLIVFYFINSLFKRKNVQRCKIFN